MQGTLPESQGQNVAVPVVRAPNLFDSGCEALGQLGQDEPASG